MQSLDDVVKELDYAVNHKDKEAVLGFYEENSLLVIQPGRVARGKSEIADFFDYVFKFSIFRKISISSRRVINYC